jgi:hypothetical protein
VKRLNLAYNEPAVLRGIVTALITLAASLGFVVTDDVKGAAEALIPVAAFLIPLAQSLWTRRAVVPAAKHVDQLAQVASGGHVVIPHTPGRPDHAA